MLRNQNVSRPACLAVGVFLGLAASYLLPQQMVKAVSTDRDSKFAMTTIEVSPVGDVEGIFVLDFLTGQLTGGVIDPKTGKFLTRYARNVAADFNVDPKAEPHYAIVTGRANLNVQGPVSPATGVVYVGELSSGKILCYTFPYQVGRRGVVAQLTPVDGFQFREAAQL